MQIGTGLVAACCDAPGDVSTPGLLIPVALIVSEQNWKPVQNRTPARFPGFFQIADARRCQARNRSLIMAKPLTYAQWSLEPYCIGMKLRALRTQKKLTLSRLAAETGLSTALLSKLETDRMIPTLPTLATICRVYGVGMSHFFAEPARHTLSITRKAHLQAKGRGLESVKITPLSPEAEGPGLSTPAAETGHRGPRLVAQMVEFPSGGAATKIDSLGER